jgi:hypothetical protein
MILIMNDYEIRNLKDQLSQLRSIKKKADDGDLYWFLEHYSKKSISHRSSIYDDVCNDIILAADNKNYNGEIKLAAIKNAINWGIGKIEAALKNN